MAATAEGKTTSREGEIGGKKEAKGGRRNGMTGKVGEGQGGSSSQPGRRNVGVEGGKKGVEGRVCRGAWDHLNLQLMETCAWRGLGSPANLPKRWAQTNRRCKNFKN